MASLTWTVDLKLNEVPIASVPHSLEVEREWYEVVLKGDKKDWNLPAADGKGELVLLKVEAKNAKKDSVEMVYGKKTVSLNKAALYTKGISGISGPKQEVLEVLAAPPKFLKFVNKSQNAVTIEVQIARRLKGAK
jgi:hypothetical protein